ncbi:hypothetical protein GGS24DRAFT_459428 [Hypoxylon argillaceum]|nr:hypothetical protein GGS24DRAFT_459428 [Hypoxylon argillaceum]
MDGVDCLVLICHRPLFVHILPGPLRPGPFPPARDRQSGQRTCRAASLSSSNSIGSVFL